MIATLLLIPTDLLSSPIVRSRCFKLLEELPNTVDFLINMIRQSPEMENLVSKEKEIMWDSEELSKRDDDTIIGDILREDFTWYLQISSLEGDIHKEMKPQNQSENDVQKLPEYLKYLELSAEYLRSLSY